MITRKEFESYFALIGDGRFADEDSPLWIPEHDLEQKCVAFIRLSYPINLEVIEVDKVDFWEWCHHQLNGEVRCFSSGDDEEWWGFTDPSDIVLWVLKWA